MNILIGFCGRLSRWMNTVAEIALVFIMLLTAADVVFRAFGTGILGTYELVALGGAMVVTFSMPQTTWDNGHVYIDFLLEGRSQLVRDIFLVCTRLMGIVLFAVLAFFLCRKGIMLRHANELSQTLHVPFYPVAFALSFCMLVQCYALVVGIFRSFGRGGQQ